MARDTPRGLSRLVMHKYKDGFGELDWGLPLQGPFDITNHLDSFHKEAEVKNCVVVINIALVPFEEYWGEVLGQPERTNDEQPE